MNVIICGNDGTGKSFICEQLNKTFDRKIPNVKFYERSSKDGENFKSAANIIDEMTTKFPEPFPKELDLGENVFCIILDCDPSVSQKRISRRPITDDFEKYKSLFYFRNAFRSIAAYFGIPVIDNSEDVGIKDVEDRIFELLVDGAKLYKEIRSYALVNLRPEDLLNENKFTKYFEGESKKLFLSKISYHKNVVFILLKPSIYSHSRQYTLDIPDLHKIRARGAKYLLENFRRQGISHAYWEINSDTGIIVSDFIHDYPPLEFVVKSQYTGTDKHSYYKLSKLPDGRLLGGEYFRVDYRNPNHVHKESGLSATEYFGNEKYYQMEEKMGKEKFMKEVLSGQNGFFPLGDKCISEDLVGNVGMVDMKSCKLLTLKSYFAIASLYERVGLKIIDCCFMMDSRGTKLCSEVNQDCMRMETMEGVHLDKDIFRTGGSSSAGEISNKWEIFNGLFEKYFRENPFHKTSMLEFNKFGFEDVIQNRLDDLTLKIPNLYKHLYGLLQRSHNFPRRFLLTLDVMDRKPVLVKSGKIHEVHSGGDLDVAMRIASIHPDVLVVNLNGALAVPGAMTAPDTAPVDVNDDFIKRSSMKYYTHVGGGIRNLETAQRILQNSARRITVSSNCDKSFIEKIPKERLCVELSVDENLNVLIHGRKTNTGVKIFEKLMDLDKLNVECISITFHSTEGHLQGFPREQLREIISKMPNSFKKIFVAGGISSMSDLRYLWSFPRVIPQLGSAFWKKYLLLGEIYCEMLIFDENGKIPTTVQDDTGLVKSTVYLTREEIRKCVDERKYLTDDVLHVAGSYDNTSFIIITDSKLHGFGSVEDKDTNYSCYPTQNPTKTGLRIIADHIKSKMNSDSYSGKMQQNPGVPLAKVIEEFWELVCANEKSRVSESADVLVHLIMYLNGMGVSIQDILSDLNARRWDPKIFSLVKSKNLTVEENVYRLAIAASKYIDKTDEFAEQFLGFRIVRGKNSRDMKLDYEIIDEVLFKKFFGNKKLILVGLRPKDMPISACSKLIHGAITWSSVIENFPVVFNEKISVENNKLKVALICRSGEKIDPSTWSPQNKALIGAEHVNFVMRYLRDELQIPENHFSINRLLGSSESPLVNDKKYMLCDSVVETGNTLKENNLEVWRVVKNGLKIGLYESCLI